jgi:hypothetical protein
MGHPWVVDVLLDGRIATRVQPITIYFREYPIFWGYFSPGDHTQN